MIWRRKFTVENAAAKMSDLEMTIAARFKRAARYHDNRIPHETRIAVLERAADHCEGCGRPLSSFNSQLHHVTYCRAYGDELPEDLMALCDDCHKAEHGL
jgi:5-methylcytosine-specific restriction endonuclease McrA